MSFFVVMCAFVNVIVWLWLVLCFLVLEGVFVSSCLYFLFVNESISICVPFLIYFSA